MTRAQVTKVREYRKRLANWGITPPTCRSCGAFIEAGQLIGYAGTSNVLHATLRQCAEAAYLAALNDEAVKGLGF